MCCLQADGPSTVALEGGTHNGEAPSVDFLRIAYLPLLERMGACISIDFHRHGFYPAGAGRWQCTVEPCKRLSSLYLMAPGKLMRREALVLFSNISDQVAQRQLALVQAELKWEPERFSVENVNSVGPGNIVSLRLHHEHVAEVFEATGAKGTCDEVATRALIALNAYQAREAAVGEYLCDQLLLPLSLGAGGCFTTGKLSEHTLTNMHVIRTIAGRCFDVTDLGEGVVQVSI